MTRKQSPRKRSKTSSIVPILILCAAAAIWIYDLAEQGDLWNPLETRETTSSSPTVTTGKYETYQNCTLVPERGNDGDSFRIKLPDGRKEIFRLYYVDAPESAFRTYRNGQNNHARIDQQAMDLGQITPQEAVEVGKAASDFALNLMAQEPFTIHTEWDSPFNDQRYHAFVVLNYEQEPRFLHELLVEKGLARIHTKGSEMPDGTTLRKQTHHLRNLQRSAQSRSAGAWGYRKKNR